jgi:hypothetical protein
MFGTRLLHDDGIVFLTELPLDHVRYQSTVKSLKSENLYP